MTAPDHQLPSQPPSSNIAATVREHLPGSVVMINEFRGDLTLTVKHDAWVQAATLLRDHPACDFKLFLDLCGVDHLNRTDHEERFEVVLHLYSVSNKHRVRLTTLLPESDPKLDTLTSIFKGANWFEREAYDLFGIVFRGHPCLKRILTHGSFVGYPLRKDYPTAQRHVPRQSMERVLDVPEGSEGMIVNLGPSHPSMHGTFRVQLLLDGETIVDAAPDLGYMHRNFEKMAESRTYWQIIPYTDRLNYCSSFMNGHGWVLAVEKLLGIQAPPRAEAVRVILSELSRVMDHLVCIGANVVDLGAITPFFVTFRARESVYDVLEACCGARLTVSYVRVGGLAQDVPQEFEELCRRAVVASREVIDQADRLLTRNVIFAKRMRDVGVLSAEDALSFGWTGPCLRGSGVAYDVRKDHPYSGYDRYLVRMEEMRQSLRIVEQALANLPGGPVIVDDKKVALPPKSAVFENIEALMNHFKLVYEGILPPVGEVYGYTEAANGELGYFIASDGRKFPWRVKVRPPCFNLYQAYPQLIKGGMIADAIAIIGGLNIIAGELDR